MSERLGPEWSVTVRSPERLVLTRAAGVDRARALRLFIVMAGSVLAALALVVATPSGLEVATFPVAALLLIVAVLALTSAARSLALALRGVRLEFTPSHVEGTLASRGIWHDLRGLSARHPVDQVEAVDLRRVNHPGLVLSLLEVRLKNGQALQGPEVATAPGSVDPLEAVAREGAALIHRPFVSK